MCWSFLFCKSKTILTSKWEAWFSIRNWRQERDGQFMKPLKPSTPSAFVAFSSCCDPEFTVMKDRGENRGLSVMRWGFTGLTEPDICNTHHISVPFLKGDMLCFALIAMVLSREGGLRRRTTPSFCCPVHYKRKEKREYNIWLDQWRFPGESGNVVTRRCLHTFSWAGLQLLN